MESGRRDLVCPNDSKNKQMAMRRELAIALGDSGKHLEAERITPLPNVGRGFRDLADQCIGCGPDLTLTDLA